MPKENCGELVSICDQSLRAARHASVVSTSAVRGRGPGLIVDDRELAEDIVSGQHARERLPLTRRAQ